MLLKRCAVNQCISLLLTELTSINAFHPQQVDTFPPIFHFVWSIRQHPIKLKNKPWRSGLCCPEMVNRKRDVSLTVHLLYQCHMAFATAPPLEETTQSLVHSFLREKLMWSQILTNSFAPSSTRYTLDPFSSRHISSEHSDIKIPFFRHTNQEKINFVPDLSLSQL